MKFTAAKSPNLKSDEELLVLCHNDRRVLVRLPDSYEGAENLAKEEFGIEGPVQFETNELAECEGLRVQVRWDTWKTASMVSAQLFVRGVAANHGKFIAGSKNSTRKIVFPQVQEHPVKRKFADENLKGPDVPEFHKIKPRATLSSSSKLLTPTSSTSSINPDEPVTQDSKPASLVEIKHEPVESDEDEDDDDDALMQSAVEWSDDESEREPQIKDESESEGQGDARMLDKTARKALVIKGKSRAVDTSSDSEHQEGSSLLQAENSTFPASQERASPLAISRKMNGGLSRVKSMPMSSKADTAPTTLAKIPKPRVARKTTQNDEAGTSSPKQITPPPDAPPPADSREQFLINVEYKNGDSFQEKQFRIRGDHAVHKVLSRACKEFEIEGVFERARLVLVDDDEDADDGSAFSYNFECDNQKTMAKEGAREGATFRILIERDMM